MLRAAMVRGIHWVMFQEEIMQVDIAIDNVVHLA
jgi:hypothetical protein